MLSDEITLCPPAKLNLFLRVLQRRPDGYHRLQTVYQFLDFSDRLHLRGRTDGHIRLEVLPEDPAPGRNLVLRAARLLRAHTGCRAGAQLRLDKKIPAGGGLGGGSSDAAAALLGLNALWGTGLCRRELATLGRYLGADVPVFIYGRSAWAEGAGDVLQPLHLPQREYLLIVPSCRISTAAVFAHPALTHSASPITISRLCEYSGRNDCEQAVCALCPEVGQALRLLSAVGAAAVTGTGSCVYAAIEHAAAVDRVRAALPAAWCSYRVSSLHCSPLAAENAGAQC